MKKVKIMLMATLVVAAVGGALAFKTKSPGLFCGTSYTSCPTQTQNAYTFVSPGQPSIPNIFCSDNQNPSWCKPVTFE